MTLKIGNFVYQDFAIAEVQRPTSFGYTGQAYLSYCELHLWNIAHDARKITLQDIEYIAEDIKDGYKPDKEFLNRLAQWCLFNLT